MTFKIKSHSTRASKRHLSDKSPIHGREIASSVLNQILVGILVYNMQISLKTLQLFYWTQELLVPVEKFTVRITVLGIENSSFKFAKVGNFTTMEVPMFLAQILIYIDSVMSQAPIETVKKIKTVLYYNRMSKVISSKTDTCTYAQNLMTCFKNLVVMATTM